MLPSYSRPAGDNSNEAPLQHDHDVVCSGSQIPVCALPDDLAVTRCARGGPGEPNRAQPKVDLTPPEITMGRFRPRAALDRSDQCCYFGWNWPINRENSLSTGVGMAVDQPTGEGRRLVWRNRRCAATMLVAAAATCSLGAALLAPMLLRFLPPPCCATMRLAISHRTRAASRIARGWRFSWRRLFGRDPGRALRFASAESDGASGASAA